MTKDEEDALVTRVMETEWDERELRLAIRAAVAAERERCAKVCEREADGWHLACEANMRDASRDCAAAIRRGP